jgi:hypothetical protein
VKEYLVHFAGVVKEALDGRNSLRGIPKVLRAIGLCRGAGSYGKPIFKFKFKGNRAIGSKLVRVIGSLTNSHFADSRAEGSKTLHQDS